MSEMEIVFAVHKKLQPHARMPEESYSTFPYYKWVSGCGDDKEWKPGPVVGRKFVFFFNESFVTFSLDIAVVVASYTSSTFRESFPLVGGFLSFFFSTNFQRLSDFRCSALSGAIRMRSDF